MELSIIQEICVWILPVLFAITLHEAAHGWVAYKLGDPTAKLLGRVTLNPLPHIDPIGTIAVPLLLGYMTHFQFLFGWAKPVPITPQNFKHLRKDSSLVAIAGPTANLLMALLWGITLKISLTMYQAGSTALEFLAYASKAGILINIVLFALNVLPIPPLDGSRVVSNLMPPRVAYYYDKLEPYGFLIIMVLAFSKLLNYLLTPIMSGCLMLLRTVLSL